MKEMWNPYDMDGAVMPFEEFKSWRELIEHYVVPQNEIVREGGPGDAIQAGEWYLTSSSPSALNPSKKEWVICYVGPNGHQIKYRNLGKLLSQGIDPKDKYWDSGAKDGWGWWKYHYKVDIEDVLNFDFLNWINEYPLEVKQ